MTHILPQVSSGGRRSWLLRGSALACVLAVAWAGWARIEQVTRASGQVIASGRNQVVQTPDGGVIEELLVHEGSVVKRGQLLFKLEATKAQAAWRESAARTAALRATAARLQAEVFGGEPRFANDPQFAEFERNQRVLFTRRQSAINEEVAALQQALDLVKTELQLNEPLVKSGDVSRADILRLQRQVADIQGQITNRRNKYLQDSQAELAKAQEDLSSAEQVLAQRKEQLDYTQAHAPTDGIVRNVRITTRGGVARPGEEILQIVPQDGDLLVEVKVKPADIGFVKPGLPATLKLDAWDYTIYGTLQGVVTYISADTLTEETRTNEPPYYRVQIRINDQSLSRPQSKELAVQPGMTVTAEIRTGSSTVLRYITKPVTKTLSESLGER